MEEFDNVKMEHAFMKTIFLIYQMIYQNNNKRSQVEQWELHKEQVNEIIREAFESYWKDEELYQWCLETY
jgi:hypothetical protein